MKSLLYFILLGIVLSSCNSKANTNDNEGTSSENEIVLENTQLQGAWELVGFYNYNNNVVTDSFTTSKGYRQVKMYTPTKVMWCKNVPADSTEWFGYGRYELDGDQLTEVLDYGSEMMSKIIQEKKEFIYEVTFNGNSFSQIEIDEDGNRIYSENYKRIE
ncbi:hypothetical protein AB9K26_06295 [Psychroserpens sp. XS_ASV72]|uniref:hypothetical protein n=1 Tax=Psychroserpens sp. XS_ASV72 TaxID=3241293 RepID=UPI003514348D